MKHIITLALLFFNTSCIKIGVKLFKNKYYKMVFLSEKKHLTQNIVLSFDLVNNRIVVPVTIDSVQYNFIFDTHAFGTIAKEIDLKNPEFVFTHHLKDGNHNTEGSELIRKDILLGHQLVSSYAMFKTDLSKFSFGNTIKIDGLLGQNILNQGVFYFNMEQKTLTIVNDIKELNLSKNINKIPLKINFGMASIKIGSEWVEIDSGYNGFMCIPPSSKLIKNEKPKETIVSKRASLFSEEPCTTDIYEKNVKIGNTSYFGRIECDRGKDKLKVIGTKFLFSGDFILDYANKNLYLINSKVNNN